MLATPFLAKPILYGSAFANWSFMVLLVLHVLPAVFAVVAGVLALRVKKGSDAHIAWGMYFCWAMLATAATGIALDVIRLSFYVTENHQKYPGFSMPSSYPARIAFLYAAFCVFYLVRQAQDPRNLSRSETSTNKSLPWSALLLFMLGGGLSVLIWARYNPWTGALWIIWTFMLILFTSALLPLGTKKIAAFGLHQHRLGMLSLAAFSWWGALQGFAPALLPRLTGTDSGEIIYTGNLPGSFSPAFFFFLLAWLPPFLLGAYLMWRYGKAKRPRT